ISEIDPHAIVSVRSFCDVRIKLLRAAPVLRLTRMAELRIRAVLEQNICPRLVVENAAETIAETRRGQPLRHSCLVDDVPLCALFDKQIDQPIPASIGGT